MAEPTDTITSVQISKTEIAVGSADGFVYRYDIVAGKLRRDYVASEVCSFMLADGCLLVQSQDGNLRLLDANGGKYIFHNPGSLTDSPRINQNHHMLD